MQANYAGCTNPASCKPHLRPAGVRHRIVFTARSKYPAQYGGDTLVSAAELGPSHDERVVREREELAAL